MGEFPGESDAWAASDYSSGGAPGAGGVLPSYPKVWTLGSKPTEHLLNCPVVVQEKIDGSCFSFGCMNGQMRYRSHHREIFPGENNQFTLAIAAADARQMLLRPGWYHGEFLARLRHNQLKYDRIPKDHIIIFDVQDERGYFLRWDQTAAEARRLGLECVPTLRVSDRMSKVDLDQILAESTSILGGPMEGIVIKARENNLYGPDGKPIFGKIVRPEFREVQGQMQPFKLGIIDQLASEYATPARWRKALQRLREEGRAEGSPRDIGPLMKTVQQDTHMEEEEEIKEKLFRWAWPQLSRRLSHGVPQWYKAVLLEDVEAEAAVDVERNGRCEQAERAREAAHRL